MYDKNSNDFSHHDFHAGRGHGHRGAAGDAQFDGGLERNDSSISTAAIRRPMSTIRASLPSSPRRMRNAFRIGGQVKSR